mmetsp:Transcript_43842/g.103667  ORF Transcript_43842/g.103667 Transcript_43842/m.103667 type:complete len:90 (-) Transcript_43842:512-781(-)
MTTPTYQKTFGVSHLHTTFRSQEHLCWTVLMPVEPALISEQASIAMARRSFTCGSTTEYKATKILPNTLPVLATMLHIDCADVNDNDCS